MTPIDYLLLILAGYLAGVLNTIAGGGSFLTFPALVYAGIPPIAANATSAVAVLPGYLGGTLGFKRELKTLDRAMLVRLSLLGLAGGITGALLLLITPAAVFDIAVPFLLLGATLLFAFGNRLMSLMRRSGQPLPMAPGLLAVAVYGGYFNGGLGIMLLAQFAAAGMQELNLMNGLKNLLSFVLSSISVAAFAIAGIVEWPEALIMMIAATLGGYSGAGIARALPVAVVRAIVIAVGLVMTLVFLLK
ncbi:sulfite exporter TauE/SafE family protein [Marinobacterium rhizophilum]|uniref:sulfite exporter TauE/SafE family protein n=1 Tax=Marinobacterium rhizophilum TaxID=420402 RepID=UPI0003820EC4|nr:sulfite exporter TauE/SafE family protein [Marinobacterium rhizophilum]